MPVASYTLLVPLVKQRALVSGSSCFMVLLEKLCTRPSCVCSYSVSKSATLRLAQNFPFLHQFSISYCRRFDTIHYPEALIFLEILNFSNFRASFPAFFLKLFFEFFRWPYQHFHQGCYLFQLSSSTWLSLAQTGEANLLLLAVLFQLCYLSHWVAVCQCLGV